MKRLLLVAVVLLLAVGVMSAGEMKQGTMSLNFTINGLGNFGVTGAPSATADLDQIFGFGASYYIQDDMFLRLGLGFANANINQKDVIVTGDEQDNTVMFFGIQPALLWNFMNEGNVSGYWGPQVMYGMASNSQDYTPPTGAVQSTSVDYTDFGAGVVVGATWTPWDQVGFSAEYGFMYASSSSSSDNGTTTTDGPSLTGFGISSWAVALNLYLR